MMKTIRALLSLCMVAGGLQTGYFLPAAYAFPAAGTTVPTINAASSAAHASVPSGNLSGVILDHKTDLPVEFATVGIYSEEDSSLISGSISDEEGKFNVEKIPHGNYYIDVR